MNFLWPPLSGGHLHCKFGVIWIRHYRAIYALKLRLCFSCQYTHSVCTCPFILGRMTDTLITSAYYLMHTDKCIMYSYISILQCSEEVFQCHYTSFQFARAKVKMFYLGTAPKISLIEHQNCSSQIVNLAIQLHCMGTSWNIHTCVVFTKIY